MLNAYTDDYGEFFVDGALIGSYNNPSAAGNIIASLHLSPGWHDLFFIYRNQAGTNRLGFSWQLPGDTTFNLIPETSLRSQDRAGALVPGLRSDYYDFAGAFQFTQYGEGAHPSRCELIHRRDLRRGHTDTDERPT